MPFHEPFLFGLHPNRAMSSAPLACQCLDKPCHEPKPEDVIDQKTKRFEEENPPTELPIHTFCDSPWTVDVVIGIGIVIRHSNRPTPWSWHLPCIDPKSLQKLTANGIVNLSHSTCYSTVLVGIAVCRQVRVSLSNTCRLKICLASCRAVSCNHDRPQNSSYQSL